MSEELQTYIDPIIGWRMWRSDGKLLYPLAVDTLDAWTPGKRSQAICLHSAMRETCSGGGVPPNPGCECGYWALKQISPGLMSPTKFSYLIIGRVALWGKVLIGSSGWRAQYAYPWELCGTSLSPPEDMLRKMGQSYGVEVFMDWQKRLWHLESLARTAQADQAPA